MNQPNPQTVDAAAVLPHMQQQIGNMSLQLAASTALVEQHQQTVATLADQISQRDELIASQAKKIERLESAGKPKTRARSRSTGAAKAPAKP